MTAQTVLLEIGQYLLFAIVLILLLFLLVLAVALFLTLFMRVFIDISLKTKNGELKNKIYIRFKFLFYKTDLFESDNFDEDEDDSEDEDEKNSVETGDESETKSAAEKNRYHLTITDEKISVQKELCQNSYSDYEIILHTDGTAAEIKSADFAKTENVETIEIEKSEREADILFQTEKSSGDFNNFNEKYDGFGNDSEDDSDNDSEPKDESDFESTDKSGFESTDEPGSEAKNHLKDDFSESIDEIKRYVDLSNPKQFVSDSISAFSLISKSAARLTSDLLFQTDIDKMSANIVYGLSDPSNTALSFGAVYSFNASVCTFLSEIESESKSSKKRKKAAELNEALRNDLSITPNLTCEMLEADADFSFSFRVSRLFIPLFRFLFRKSSRKVFFGYIYPYFIKQYIRTWKTDRKQKKEEKKEEKKAKKQQRKAKKQN